MNNNIPKKALCIRNTSTWGHIKPQYKFDSDKFNADSVLKDLPIMSPKINYMLDKIKELDEKDMASEGKYYKHIIYSDVDGSSGAKMVASAMIANNYKPIYNKGVIKTKYDNEDNYNTFGLLTKSVVNKKPLTVGLKKNMMTIMNNRESGEKDNINGKNMRFIILDSGFKEGIDVFDVKYMHILEPLITKAENTQVIGRGTRYCGQSGLPFIPNVGWPLNIYRYNIKYDDNMTVHDLFIKHSNENISILNFVAELEDIMIASAVDLPLTENIHYITTKNNRFLNYIRNNMGFGNNKSVIKIKNIRGSFRNDLDNINCEKNCIGILEYKTDDFNPDNLLISAALHVIKIEYVKELPVFKKSSSDDDKKMGNKSWEGVFKKKIRFNEEDKILIKAFNKKLPKVFLCQKIDKRRDFCDAINEIWKNKYSFFKKHGNKILEKLDDIYKINKISTENYNEVYKYIFTTMKEYKQTEKPPATKLNIIELNKYISKNYKKYYWDIPIIENKCIADLKKDDDKKIVSFSNTQLFVQKYLTPQSPYKGVFLYHSVGSGKTCTAIATATNTFNKEGYTILWVTRHTLKEDIWKNMFDNICNVIIQEKLKSGEIKDIPKLKSKRLELLGDSWIQPISYKQFTNMIKGKNKFYNKMVKINGKEDPFKKTLIIIDEIHKIYSNSLSAIEKPNPAVLQEMIQKSYSASGKESLRLILMSATPITEDPMSSIKILNLLLENDNRMPEDFEMFKKKYCNDNGIIVDSKILELMNNMSGLISYIDRSNDKSQFAYPVMNDIICNIDVSTSKLEDKLSGINKNIEDIKDKIEKYDNKKNKAEIKELKAQLKIEEKERKSIVAKFKEPKSILDYINKCFTNKSK
jgi:superfamily II DNA or RNA helicase